MWIVRLLIAIGLWGVAAILALVALVLYTGSATDPSGRTSAYIVAGCAGLMGLAGLLLVRRRRIPMIATMDPAWGSEPATEKQKRYARDLGISFHPNISKRELSALITRKTGR